MNLVMGYPLVYILILNWNQYKDTIECIESCKNLNYENYRILIIDNGSTDNSEAILHGCFPNLEILQTGKNLGYSGGNNMGINYALEKGAEYLLLLNNDTVVDSGLIRALVEASKRIPKRGLFGAKVYFYSTPDVIWAVGSKWDDDLSNFRLLGHGLVDSKAKFNSIMEIDMILGCCLFINRNAIANIGLMDERFFLMHEESDWCCRAKKRGYKCYLVPDAKIWHKVSVSFGGTNTPLIRYYDTRNRALWAKKHLSFAKRIFLFREILNDIFLNSYPNKTSSKISAKYWYWALLNVFSPINKARLLGLKDYFLHRFGPAPYQFDL